MITCFFPKPVLPVTVLGPIIDRLPPGCSLNLVYLWLVVAIGARKCISWGPVRKSREAGGGRWPEMGTVGTNWWQVSQGQVSSGQGESGETKERKWGWKVGCRGLNAS